MASKKTPTRKKKPAAKRPAASMRPRPAPRKPAAKAASRSKPARASGKNDAKRRKASAAQARRASDARNAKTAQAPKAPKTAPVEKSETTNDKAASAAAKTDRSAPKERRERRSTPPPPPPREPPRVLPLPVLPPARKPTIEERAARIEQRLAAQTEEFRRTYTESFDMSWIHHDSALEGIVYTQDELRAALSGQPLPPVESGIVPATEEIRRHKEAIDFVRDFATKKRLPVTVDVIKKIYLILHPEEGDIKTVKYRKDVPQHRLYFHEYAAPDKIAYKVRQIVDWLNDPETRKTRHGIRIAARAHYDLLRVYPFPVDSGKVARLFMNLLLLRAGLPPSIIHATERQRYYDALKGSAQTVFQMVQESVENALASVEKLLDEHETRMRAFVS